MMMMMMMMLLLLLLLMIRCDPLASFPASALRTWSLIPSAAPSADGVGQWPLQEPRRRRSGAWGHHGSMRIIHTENDRRILSGRQIDWEDEIGQDSHCKIGRLIHAAFICSQVSCRSLSPPGRSIALRCRCAPLCLFLQIQMGRFSKVGSTKAWVSKL